MYLPQHEGLSVETSTARAAFDIILQGNAPTRNQIAQALGISAMTVGKVVRALLSADLIREAEAPTARGRHPLCLLPSQRLHCLTVRLTLRAASVLLCSAEGNVLERLTVSYNDSLPPEGNLASLRGLCDRVLRQWGKSDTGLGVGAILGEDLHCTDLLARSLDEILGADVILWERDLRKQALADPRYGECVVYLSLDEDPWAMLYVGQTEARGVSLNDKQSRAERKNDLLQAIIAMLPIACPTAVVAESEGPYSQEAASFLQVLSDRLSSDQRSRIRLHAPTDRLIAEQEMRRALCHHYAAQWAEKNMKP